MSAQWIKAMLADDAEVDDLGNVVEEVDTLTEDLNHYKEKYE